jgi:hypothetical protein
MDAFLAELKTARLRRVTKVSSNDIGERSGVRDEDKSFASSSSKSFTSLLGSGSGSEDSSFSRSFSLADLEGSSTVIGAHGPAPAPSNYLRSRLRKVHPDRTHIGGKDGSGISKSNIVSSNGRLSGPGSKMSSMSRDSEVVPLWNNPSRTTRRPPALDRTKTSKKDIIDLTMDGARERMDAVVDTLSSQNNRLKRQRPESGEEEPLREGVSIARCLF